MDSVNFDPSLYIERDVDQALWSKLTQWVQERRKTRWISLRSKSGHGNTWLLTRINYLATHSSNFNTGIRTILVEGDPAGDIHPPRQLSPLAAKLFEIYSTGRMSPLKRLKLRLHNASSRQLVKAGTVLLLGLLTTCLFVGFNQYVTSINSKLLYVHQWFPRFWSEYFWEHLLDFPIWFITGSIAGLPFSTAILYLARNRILPRQTPDSPPDQELEYLRSSEGLAFVLHEICKGWRGLLLLVDDAHCLPQVERQFLHELFSERSQSQDIRQFRNKHSILIVTLDTHEDAGQVWLPDGAQDFIELLEVPAFNLLELRDVARLLLPESSDNGSADTDDEEAESILEQAHQNENVKVLFAHRQDQLIEEMGREFRKAQEDDIESVFGLDEIMLFQAVRLEPFPVEKKELLNWLKSLSSNECLPMFGIEPSNREQQLLKDFLGQTTLVRTSGKICYFNTTRSRALQQWLKKNAPQQLAQAHYFWFWSSLRKVTSQELEPDSVASLPAPQQQAIKEGVWHVARIGYLENATSVLSLATGLTDEQRHQRCYEVVAALLSSAAIYRSEGDINEADELIIDAEEWLCNPDGARREQWLACVAEQLWRDYWLSGERATRDQLDTLLKLFPQLSASSSWILNVRLEELLQGKEVLSPRPSGPPESDPALCNIDRLTELLLVIRQSHGFIESALRDEAVAIGEPLVASGDTTAEFYLRQLQVMALNEREGGGALVAALDQWRERLRETAPTRGHIGDEAIHSFNEARYWHVLADVLRKNLSLISDLPVNRISAAQEELRTFLTEACLKPPAADTELAEFIWMEAQYAYERALQIAALLGWRTLVLEVCFHLATLLQRYTPQDRRAENAHWWVRWDRLYSQCIELEKELGYLFHTPSIHRIRWKFLEQTVSREHCVEDAYNTLKAVQRAHYPNTIKLHFHDDVSGLLNNYGETDVNRRRSAELHKMWAYHFAGLPEAEGLRKYQCLEYEQADNLNFAAQAHRHLQEFGEADKLLDEAAELLKAKQQSEVTGQDEEGEEDKNLRELRLTLSLQRAWLFQDQDLKHEYHTLIRELWGAVRPDDRIYPNLMGTMLNVEYADNLLMEHWPTGPDHQPHIDPDNSELSLPVHWFEGEEPLVLRTRFEFRLRQFLSLSYPMPWPTVEALRMLAYFDWQMRSRYSETGVRFGQYGLEFKAELSEDTVELLTILLQTIHFYFAEIDEVARYELEVLLLRMKYEEDSIECRVEYIKALRKHQYLLEREIRIRQEAQDWFAVADRVDDYLGVLVDQSLLAQKAGVKLRHSGIPLEKVKEMREWRKGIYKRARAAYASGSYAAAMQLLTPALPVSPSAWVFLEDLQVINLWLQCAKASGEARIDEINRRATQLRKSALQYIHHFSEIIEDIQVQMLALEVLNVLQKSVEVGDPELSRKRA